MPFIAFKLTKETLYRGAAWAAARDAVLWPLCPPRGRPPDVAAADWPGKEVDAHQRLRRLWRQRVRVLRDAGWAALIDPNPDPRGLTEDGKQPSFGKRATYMANCPPFGVAPSVKAYCCNRVRLCPYCYARDVVAEAYKAMEFALYTIVQHDDAAARRRLRLVGVRREFDAVDASSDGGLDGLLRKIERTSRRTDHEKYVKAGVRVLAARSGFTVEPSPTAPGRFRVCRGYVAAVAADSGDDDVPTPDGIGPAAVRVTDVSRANLAKLVARCFPYPVGMMRADPRAALGILEATAATRAKFVASFAAADNAATRDVLRRVLPVESDGVDGERDMPPDDVEDPARDGGAAPHDVGHAVDDEAFIDEFAE